MIVEFISIPGAGKTTLLPTVTNFFNEQGFRAYSVLEAARPFAGRTLPGKLIIRLAPQRWQRPLLWQLFYHLSNLYRLKFMLKHRQLVWMVYRFQRQRPISNADRHHVLHWFFHLLGRYEFLKRYAQPDEVIVIDEGFAHRVVQLYASENEEPALVHLRAYVNLIPQPDLIVFPAVAADVCEGRVYQRGIWERFAGRSAAELSRYFANAGCVVAFAVREMQRKGWLVLRVDNEDEGAAVAQGELWRLLEYALG